MVKAGLRELNSDISFDVANTRPSDYSFVFQCATLADAELQRKGFSGVYHLGRYIVAMDRGASLPEYKVWEEVDGIIPIPLADIERYDDTHVVYVEILKGDINYNNALLMAQRGDDNYQIREDGKVFRFDAFRPGKNLGSVLKVGWRHTFEGLVRAKIPGVTRDSLSRKFRVDMTKIPQGDRETVTRALYEEA